MDIIHILFNTGFTIVLLLFSFLTDYVTIEKRMTYMGGIWAVLIMFTFIGSDTNNMTRNELMVYTFICLCLSFMYASAIERTKRKFRIEKDIQDVQQSLWKEQLKQLLIACVISLPSFILFHYLPATNHTLVLIAYLVISVSVSLAIYLSIRRKIRNGQDADNDTLILCYYFLSALCVVSELDLNQVALLMFLNWILLIVYDGAILVTQTHLKMKTVE